MKARAVASLTVLGGQEFHFPHFFLNFDQFFLIFPQTFLIFFLISALRVGESPIREGPMATPLVKAIQAEYQLNLISAHENEPNRFR